ncbi:MAG: TRAP transporter large permease [Rubrimonas sp.]
MALPLIALIALFAAGVPIALALGMAALPTLIERGIPLIALPQVVFDSLDSFALMALPLYVLAGKLMQHGGIADRLVGFAIAVVGWLPGGLAAAVVLTSMLFATISGSSAATAAAIGSVLVPQLERQRYPRPFSASVVASSGELGVILPPSVPMVIFAVITGGSITELFIGGLLPGLMIGLSLIVTTTIIARVKGYGVDRRVSPAVWARDVGAATRRAALSLLMPVIILGGIYGGVFTATEAAVVAVAYALLIGVCVYRELSLRDVGRVFAEAAVTAAVVMIIVGFAATFAFALTLLGAPQAVARAISAVARDPWTFLLLMNLFLLVVGMFMETFAAIIILGPILAPIAAAFGIDPVHFGVVMIVNLAIGMTTPPVGVNLFIACGIARVRMEELMRPLSIFLAVLVANLMAITFLPVLTLALIR